MKNKKIIAVVGMCGSGKTEAVKYLQEKLNCPRVYFGEVTFDRMKEIGLELNYENEKITREKIRQELGMGAYATLSLPKINQALENNDYCIIESLYSWSEYKILKENFGDSFITLAVFASPTTRFKRLSNRTNERPMKSIEEFIRRDYSEIENIEKGGPIARADFLVYNEDGLDELKKQLDIIIINKL
ncbi:MAG: Dephospho-CoA kinase-like protein [Candidatus Falkowbacteria bacterium GW2011_GWC2_38_22]|uniref:Dephospho-CoA kinase-like protein n=1 Tax=Candidatus Falkowbacteria bacterium GW2011_GWE1_38_31 TaxID=1618638 RepID=A0A0G0K2S7_9BACT|nr:MAG: Dephospho-CoA kinase-like protein [Candidatus Falkowbacteria bacterium GW2011_GWF2_38_1205]KKQ60807.1 MAG: Dephospho-CoA kinase-like protein [Candidatus Falkowbacteria bacterium GW2011_GWC2_38_22]KKQ62974.1 MAG: Dephospho-CoA kinase-like protein [Candidatus Falkowbacteria bacterium GW2011_GWF1_38_22]KKQ64986.1 MAG: Dephospho-CoA kinase-like protein [Candidatus Falkowbacteria bacterium GW2011_GWE2_38_254]KKQ69750.1 MAG: Dephospho-CoA kinase-like protein [Candidatus Falkowbacteria bacteri